MFTITNGGRLFFVFLFVGYNLVKWISKKEVPTVSLTNLTPRGLNQNPYFSIAERT